MRFFKYKWRPQDLPLKIKLLAITLTVVVLISSVAFAGFHLVVSHSNEMIYTQTAGSLNVLSDKIAGRINNIMDVSLYMAVNKEFQENLKIINREKQNAAWGQARSDLSNIIYRAGHSDIISSTVFALDGSSIVWGSTSSAEDPAILSEAIDQAAQARGAVVWLSTGRQDGSLLCVREIRYIAQPFLETMGYLVLRVDLEKIVRECAGDVLSIPDYAISIAQEGGRLYPALDAKAPVLSEERPGGAPSLYEIKRVDGSMQFLTRSAIHAFRLQWELVLGVPYEAVFQSLVTANITFSISVLSAGIVAVLLSRLLLTGINRHLLLLKRKMDRVRAGNLEPYPSADLLGEDELGTLNRYFDEMTADFKKVIEDNYVKELLLTQTQLKALEQQINPHFLYNSLESIHWFSRRGEGAVVSEIAQSLGRLLRSTLSENEDKITLTQELAILDSYLRIQQIRFPDTLRVHMEIDEAARPVLIPKMSIQPLVENAIVHALEETVGVCHIALRVALRGDTIRVEVENDGSEIEADILEKLRSKQVLTRGNGIGLINIDSRIKLLFGQEYGLHVESGSDRAVVSYEIPAFPLPRGERARPLPALSGQGPAQAAKPIAPVPE